MIDEKNIWLNIHPDSARRIEPDFNFYWVRDSNGRYGIRVNLGVHLKESDFSDRIRGIALYTAVKENMNYLITDNTKQFNNMLLKINTSIQNTLVIKPNNSLITDF